MTDPRPTFAPFRDAYQTRWHPRADTPIVGYLDGGFPEEVAIAAGLRPMLLTADPFARRDRTAGRLDLLTPGRVAHLYEGLVSDRYAFLTALVVMGGDRFMSNTYGFLDAERERTGTAPIDTLIYAERAHGTYREHRAFNMRQIQTLATKLGAVTGQAVTPPRLQAAIELVNRARQLMRRFHELRIARPGLITAVESATITLAAQLMDKQDFITALEAHLAALARAPDPVPPEITLYLCGSEIDHIELHAALDAAGVALLGETVPLAGGYGFDMLRTDIPPFDALADTATYRFPPPWMWGRDRRIRMTCQRVVASGAQRVLYVHGEHDSGTGWDFPDIRTRLTDSGVDVRLIHDLPYAMPAGDALRDLIRSALN